MSDCPRGQSSGLRPPGGQVQFSDQSARWIVFQENIACIGARHVASDSQAEAETARVPISGLFHTVERFEHFLDLVCRNAGPIVLHPQHKLVIFLAQRQFRFAAIGNGVVNEVRDAALD